MLSPVLSLYLVHQRKMSSSYYISNLVLFRWGIGGYQYWNRTLCCHQFPHSTSDSRERCLPHIIYLILFYLGEVLGVTSTGLEHYAVTSSLTLPRTPEKDVFLIFIHALQNGLFRIHMQGQTGRYSSFVIKLLVPDSVHPSVYPSVML